MFSVFNGNLQTDMGKTIVRRHLANTDAQSVWKELSEHMRTASKAASGKRRLTLYVTNTVLDDYFKGTTEQFVLHFNEQFRVLPNVSSLTPIMPMSRPKLLCVGVLFPSSSILISPGSDSS